MQQVTYDLIMSKNPCYNPADIGMPADYKDTPVNFITNYRNKVKSKNDIFWVIGILDVLSSKYHMLCKVKIVRQMQHLMKDKRSIKALDVAEAWAHGKATDAELLEARSNAYAAYRVADAYAAAAVAYAAYRVAYAAVATYAISDAAAVRKDSLNGSIDILIEMLELQEKEEQDAQ